MTETTRQKDWSIVEFEVDPANEDLAAWLMIDCGSSGCEVQPVGDSRLVIKAAFDSFVLGEREMQSLASRLEEYMLGECLKTLKVHVLQEEDWLAKWKTGFKPFSIGDRLMVSPPWEVPNIAEQERRNRKIVIIEPAMAFGTGLHATTRFCLRMVEQLQLGKKILDVGTGSGILSIAAALLDPQATPIAVDTDPIAVQAARDNSELNHVNDRITIIEGSTEAVKEFKFDSILSNMTCEDIIALLPEYRQLLGENGQVVGAGILSEKLPRLEAKVAENGFEISKIETEDMWSGVLLRKTVS